MSFRKRFSTKKGLTEAELNKMNDLSNQIIRNFIQIQKEGYSIGLELSDNLIDTTQKYNFSHLTINAMLIKAYVLLGLGKYERLNPLIEEILFQLESIKELKKHDHIKKENICNRLKAKIYFRNGNYDKSIELLYDAKQICEKNNLQKELVYTLNDVSIYLSEKGEFDTALDYLTQSLEICESYSLVHLKLMIYNNLGLIYLNRGDHNKALENFNYYNEFLSNKDHDHLNATIMTNTAIFDLRNGDINSALIKLQKSLELFEKLNSNFETGTVLINLASISELKGDIRQALVYHKKFASLINKSDNPTSRALNLNNKANTLINQGDLSKAISNYKKSIEIFEKQSNLIQLCTVFMNLYSIEEPKEILDKLQKISEITNSELIIQIIDLTNAFWLKTSGRVIRRAEAQQIFQKFAEKEQILFDYKIIAIKNLIEFLLQELQASGNESVLKELKNKINILLDLATKNELFSLLAEIKLIESKIAILELEFDLARKLLSEAQSIAENNGLESLAIVVSREFDMLLNKVNDKDFNVDKSLSLSERIEMTELEGIVTRIIKKKVDVAEIVEEEPILFLILAQSGMSIFSKTFGSEKLIDEQLIGGFLTAINVVSQQAFSYTSSIEGIKHQDYTLLMKPVEKLLFIYIFNGQSYFAHQKLNKFSESIKSSDIVWDLLSEANDFGMDLSEDYNIINIAQREFLTKPEIVPKSASLNIFSKKVTIGLRNGLYMDSLFYLFKENL